jgi:hypothetical protein
LSVVLIEKKLVSHTSGVDILQGKVRGQEIIDENFWPHAKTPRRKGILIKI